jgi:hypothetical protein
VVENEVLLWRAVEKEGWNVQITPFFELKA